MEKENEKVAILPFTENNLKKALNESKYLFIASHGFDGLVFSGPEKFYTYMDFAHYKMSKLEFIYFSACQLGVNYYSEYWQRILSPAKVVLFDRDSAIMEHVIWMLFNSIESVKELNSFEATTESDPHQPGPNHLMP